MTATFILSQTFFHLCAGDKTVVELELLLKIDFSGIDKVGWLNINCTLCSFSFWHYSNVFFYLIIKTKITKNTIVLH